MNRMEQARRIVALMKNGQSFRDQPTWQTGETGGDGYRQGLWKKALKRSEPPAADTGQIDRQAAWKRALAREDQT